MAIFVLVAIFHSSILSSLSPEASIVPSGENDIDWTHFVRPAKVAIFVFVATSQRLVSTGLVVPDTAIWMLIDNEVFGSAFPTQWIDAAEFRALTATAAGATANSYLNLWAPSGVADLEPVIARTAANEILYTNRGSQTFADPTPFRLRVL